MGKPSALGRPWRPTQGAEYGCECRCLRAAHSFGPARLDGHPLFWPATPSLRKDLSLGRPLRFGGKSGVVGRPEMSRCLVFDVVPKNSALPVLWTALCTGSTTPIKSQKKMKVERSHKTNEQKHRKKILNIDDKYSGHFRKCTPYVFAKVSSKII